MQSGQKNHLKGDAPGERMAEKIFAGEAARGRRRIKEAMHIRPTEPGDIPAIEKIYQKARKYMAESGNPDQWGKDWPPIGLIREDMARGESFVCCERGELLATFMFGDGPEPLYENDGADWLNDLPYTVVHRIASSGIHRGVGAFCLGWCAERSGNIRIDSHSANAPMRTLLLRSGYQMCGQTVARDGTPRIAFQRFDEETYKRRGR